MKASRAGLGSAREVVDLAFDAFDKEGAGALASWMILTGNEDALGPIVETIHELVDEIAPEEAVDHHEVMRVHEETLALTLMAMGNALLGPALARSLGLPADAVVMIGTEPHHRDWADAARLAKFLPAEQYFAAA